MQVTRNDGGWSCCCPLRLQTRLQHLSPDHSKLKHVSGSQSPELGKMGRNSSCLWAPGICCRADGKRASKNALLAEGAGKPASIHSSLSASVAASILGDPLQALSRCSRQQHALQPVVKRICLREARKAVPLCTTLQLLPVPHLLGDLNSARGNIICT